VPIIEVVSHSTASAGRAQRQKEKAGHREASGSS
jgi:hypothetical protein